MAHGVETFLVAKARLTTAAGQLAEALIWRLCLDLAMALSAMPFRHETGTASASAQLLSVAVCIPARGKLRRWTIQWREALQKGAPTEFENASFFSVSSTRHAAFVCDPMSYYISRNGDAARGTTVEPGGSAPDSDRFLISPRPQC
jgi:hypothetical protein